MSSNVNVNHATTPDQLLVDIADYVCNTAIESDEALETARLCFMDTLGCGLLALRYPECTKLLGPLCPGTIVKHGARVPGTSHELDPVTAAFNIGCMNRWLDYNDTWLAAEWGHPSDNLGGILAMADYISRRRIAYSMAPLTVHEVLTSMVKAHEIQGILALNNSFNRVGLDHVLLVRVATAAVITRMLGGSHAQVIDAVSHAFADGGALRTYRHAPNTGSRKSWAAGDATSRGVKLAAMVYRGEMGIPTVLSADGWGFNDVLFGGKALELAQPLASYVMENVLFKIAYPAEFHAQTAVEAAIRLHPQVQQHYASLRKIHVYTHESAIRIISKSGPLTNPADRDHCLQYMIAVPLLYGSLNADHYETPFHDSDPRIDALREIMDVHEQEEYTKDYLDPKKRSIANAIELEFSDGSHSERVAVEYPLGHRRRREEGVPLLYQKFLANLRTRFPERQVQGIYQLCSDPHRLGKTPVNTFMEMLVIN